MTNRTNKIDPTRQCFLALLLALPVLFAAAHPAHSAADPAAVEVLQIRAYQEQKLQAVVGGFAVNAEGAALTSAHTLRRAERFTVTSGAGSTEVAALAWRDGCADIVLLNAADIGALGTPTPRSLIAIPPPPSPRFSPGEKGSGGQSGHFPLPLGEE